ncbi:MAG: transposase [Gammaproteobacteria bacterium]|jgi:putative transposase
MARMKRLNPVGIPQHLIQRGNNRQACFTSEEDMAAYAHWLKNGAEKYGVEIHAWVFMTNHVHLLATPRENGAVSKMMQSLGRTYVRHFNKRYQRSGTLWEGRFRSCLVQEETYLLVCQRYIELNPVRANMVTDPGDYRWSSYHSNALGVASGLITPHPLYLALGASADERSRNYQSLFLAHLEDRHLKDIRTTLNQGLVLGNEQFRDEIAAMTGQRTYHKKPGPKKQIRTAGRKFLL